VEEEMSEISVRKCPHCGYTGIQKEICKNCGKGLPEPVRDWSELAKEKLCEKDKLYLREVYLKCYQDCEGLRLIDQLVQFGKFIADVLIFDEKENPKTGEDNGR